MFYHITKLSKSGFPYELLHVCKRALEFNSSPSRVVFYLLRQMNEYVAIGLDILSGRGRSSLPENPWTGLGLVPLGFIQHKMEEGRLGGAL